MTIRITIVLFLAFSFTGCKQSPQDNSPQDNSPQDSVESPQSSVNSDAALRMPRSQDNNGHASTAVAADSSKSDLLTEVTAQVGLPDQEAEWPDGFYLTPEITPGGVALLDYDNDGDLDIYQICHCRPLAMPNSFREKSPNRLFEQSSEGKFVEVDAAAGLNDPGYGHGAAIGDIDNDGDLDVYVTNYGPDAFFLNKGEGKFENQTKAAGFSDNKWSSAAAFFDYDQDGFLDLFVVHFATFDAARQCGGISQDQDIDYCGPHLFTGMEDQLFHNNGDGTFTDVSEKAGITVAARGWGVIATDLSGDGHADIYVCNDEEPNQLWVSNGDGTFADEAVFRGVAFNGMGRPEASMGVTLGDVDGDQTLDLFMTHVTSETNTLYTLEAEDLYNDSSSKCGTAAVDLPFTGWGCGFLDIDHDGDLDLAVANGRVAIGAVDANAKHGSFWNRYAEPNLLFRNDGNGKLLNVSSRAGTFTSRPEVTRGLAFGDIDNDGDVDLVTNDLANRLRVFRNNANGGADDNGGTKPHWLQVLAIHHGRVDQGALVTLKFDDREFVRPVLRSYSYLASNDPRAHFGLGTIESLNSIEVRWSDGVVESFEPTQFGGTGVDREIRIERK